MHNRITSLEESLESTSPNMAGRKLHRSVKGKEYALINILIN